MSSIYADIRIVDEVGFAPLDDTGTQLLFRFISAAYERRASASPATRPFEQQGRFLVPPGGCLSAAQGGAPYRDATPSL